MYEKWNLDGKNIIHPYDFDFLMLVFSSELRYMYTMYKDIIKLSAEINIGDYDQRHFWRYSIISTYRMDHRTGLTYIAFDLGNSKWC